MEAFDLGEKGKDDVAGRLTSYPKPAVGQHPF
jgi:hypothetical protein